MKTSAFVIVMALARFATAAPPQIIGPDPTKQLLLDPRVVQSVSGAKLRLGTVEKEPRNPLFKADQPWENALNNLYPNVLWDEREGVFKLWYKCVLNEPAVIARMADPVTIHDQGWYLLYATSPDGLAWTKPAIGQFEFDGKRTNNAVARDTPNVGVFRDPHDPDESRRFKMVYDVGLGKLRTRTSPDGLRWSEPQEPRGFAGFNGDTHNNAFWDERTQRYVWFTKAYLGERLVARFESKDFVEWKPSGVVLRSSVEEGRAHQTYCLPVFPYANGYLGYLMMYHVGVDRAVDCELAWSPDSIEWHRVAPGVPLIPRGPKGSYDSACIYAPSGPAVAQDGRLLIFYGGDFFPHLGWKRHCLPSLARLRIDGFAGYEPTEAETATVTTQPLLVTGELQLSADVRGGKVRVQVLDDADFGEALSEPIVTDVTDGPIRWAGKSAEQLRGRLVRFRFEFAQAKIYALRGAKLLPAPVLQTRVRSFADSLAVEWLRPEQGTIRYTTDGREPRADSPQVDGPLILRETTRLRARVFLPGMKNGGAERDEVFTRRPEANAKVLPPVYRASFGTGADGWVGTDRAEHFSADGASGGFIRLQRAKGLRPIASLPPTAPGVVAGDWKEKIGGDGAEISFQTRAGEPGDFQIGVFAREVAQWSYRPKEKLTTGWQTTRVRLRWDWNDAEAEAAGWVRGAAAFSWAETMAKAGRITIAVGTAGTATSFDLDEFAIAPFRDEAIRR